MDTLKEVGRQAAEEARQKTKHWFPRPMIATDTRDFLADAVTLAVGAELLKADEQRHQRGWNAAIRLEHLLASLRLAVSPPSGATYPCKQCGVLRTKAEGGTTFTVCDECWNAPSQPSVEAAPLCADEHDGGRYSHACGLKRGHDGPHCSGRESWPAVPLAPTPPETLKAITFPPEVTAKLLANARAVHAGKLRAAADWFTDCKTLTLEQLPVGFIEALKAGADALESSPSPGAVETPEGWQPIETAPEALPVLVYRADYGEMVTATHENKWWVSGVGEAYELGEGYTHWMPLPAPPLRSGGSR